MARDTAARKVHMLQSYQQLIAAPMLQNDIWSLGQHKCTITDSKCLLGEWAKIYPSPLHSLLWVWLTVQYTVLGYPAIRHRGGSAYRWSTCFWQTIPDNLCHSSLDCCQIFNRLHVNNSQPTVKQHTQYTQHNTLTANDKEIQTITILMWKYGVKLIC